MPGFIQPMQPEMVDALPTGEQWQYEVKWDGYRAVAVKDGDRVRLFSRNDKDLTKSYPAAARAVGRLPAKRLVIDGEIVALDEQDRPSFQRLQNAGHSEMRIVLVAFDLLNLEGRSLITLPLDERQSVLAELCAGSHVQISTAIEEDLPTVIRAVRGLGLEGVVAKRRNSTYHPGLRGRFWLKQRLDRGQELVIGGFTGGSPFDGLLVGYYEGRNLHYAGKVKAGFNPAGRRELFARLAPVIQEKCPFVGLPEKSGGRWGEGLTREKMAKCTWVKPKLIAQISFVEWTAGGHLRHAKFLGLRDDKAPRDVVRES